MRHHGADRYGRFRSDVRIARLIASLSVELGSGERRHGAGITPGDGMGGLVGNSDMAGQQHPACVGSAALGQLVSIGQRPGHLRRADWSDFTGLWIGYRPVRIIGCFRGADRRVLHLALGGAASPSRSGPTAPSSGRRSPFQYPSESPHWSAASTGTQTNSSFPIFWPRPL